MLKVQSISAFYGDVRSLSDVSIEIKTGEIVTILGSNGAGKTTLIKSICSLLPILSGCDALQEKPCQAVHTLLHLP